MQCPECGEELAPATNICPSCGSDLEHEPTVTYIPVESDPEGRVSLGEAARMPTVEGFALIVSRGPRSGMTWVLPAGVITVGRHPDNDIFLDDITVSRHHCRFVSGPEGLEVEDSGSTNGTYVNGERADRAVLEPGDEVIVGKFHLLVARGDE